MLSSLLATLTMLWELSTCCFTHSCGLATSLVTGPVRSQRIPAGLLTVEQAAPSGGGAHRSAAGCSSIHRSCRLSRLPPLAAPTCLPLLRSILHCTTLSVAAAQAGTLPSACMSGPPFSMPLFYMWPPALMPRQMSAAHGLVSEGCAPLTCCRPPMRSCREHSLWQPALLPLAQQALPWCSTRDDR